MKADCIDCQKGELEMGMTDLQFLAYKEERDKSEAERNKRLALVQEVFRAKLLAALRDSSDLPTAIAKVEILLQSEVSA